MDISRHAARRLDRATQADLAASQWRHRRRSNRGGSQRALVGSMLSLVAVVGAGCAAQLGPAASSSSGEPTMVSTSSTAPDDHAANEPTVNDVAASSSVTTTSTTTTTTLPVYDPACVAQVEPGDGLLAIAGRFDHEMLDVDTIIAENGLGSDLITPGQLLDVCVDNGMNDIDGSQRAEPNAALVERAEIEAQQEQLNRLFVELGMRELRVDGRSGPATQQRLCGFRLATGLPTSTADMAVTSDEMGLLMATETLPIPPSAPTIMDRWVLIDQTCQIMFGGNGDDGLEFVFATSTGDADHPTRDQAGSAVFKYDPAADNGGWHDSTDYPSPEDNPLNGNMYKPLYFDNGQAIHGAGNVPNFPASKGCVRLQVDQQDQLVDWLGLADQRDVTWSPDIIGLTVVVQGNWND